MKKFERRRSLFLVTFSLALPLSDRKVPNNNMRSVLQVKGDYLFKDEKPRPEAKKMRNLPISTELIGISFKGNRAQINANPNINLT